MRLIDADELMKKVNSIKYLRKLKAQQLCNECTEIEAIPVAWIENYAKTEYPLWPKRAPIRSFFTHMIEKWRNENG